MSSPWFTLGRTVTPIPELNLSKILDEDISILVGKIEKISPGSVFGRKLRSLASKSAGAGPFRHVLLKENLILTLVDDKTLGYGFAKVCENSPLFGQLLIATKATNPEYGNISFRANNNTQIQNCSSSERESEPYKVWINEKDLVDWFPGDAGRDDLTISAVARLVISDN
jgi:hypothetical protein